ncbi:MAG: TIGR03000 domain-containing protein [Planctomycetota bacterium]|nr:TIGR03000 domain-containing protein [Planctomycetota bacterium]
MKRTLQRRLAIATLFSLLATACANQCHAHWGGGSHGSSGGSSGISYGSSGGSSGHFRTPVRSYLRQVANRMRTAPYHGSHGSSGYTHHRAFYGSSGGSSGTTVARYHCVPSTATGGQAVSPKPQPAQPENQVQPPAPEKSGDKTTSLLQKGYLTVSVPAEAKIYVNDKLTRTNGPIRRYKTPELKPGQKLSFRVRAVVEKEGKKLTQTKLVDLSSGNTKHLEFAFENPPPPVTVLSLSVPENALITLAGNQMAASGPLRMFTTTSLKRGESWKDYQIVVTAQVNGKTIVKSKTIDLISGESVDLDFDFEAEYNQLAKR